jgi:ketosteroid isomerase-like protein
MKRLLGLLSLMLLFSNFTLAQADKKAAEKKGGGGVEQTVLDMERRWVAASLKSDPTAMQDILADDWSSISAEGKMLTRAQALDNMKKSKMTKSELSEMKVRMINADTAIVTGVWTGVGTDEKGQKLDTSERWMDVFASLGGKWKCVASESSTIKK